MTNNDCREAFERECTIMSLPVGRGLDYDNKKTRLCWIFWQAAWQARAPIQITDEMVSAALDAYSNRGQAFALDYENVFPEEKNYMRAALQAALNKAGG